MQKIKLMLLSLLTIFLSSCDEPKIGDLTQTLFHMGNIVTIEGKEYISVDESGCFERSYEYSRDRIGPKSEVVEVPIENCEKIIGYNPDEYAKLYEYFEALRVYLLNKAMKRKP